MNIITKCHIQSFKDNVILLGFSGVWATGTDVYWVVCELMEWHGKGHRVFIGVSLLFATIVGLRALWCLWRNESSELLREKILENKLALTQKNARKNEEDAWKQYKMDKDAGRLGWNERHKVREFKTKIKGKK